MALKGVEEEAADLLEKWLVEAGHPAEWQPIFPDPPDLAFEVKGLGRWAVEVTELRQYYSQKGSNDLKERSTIEQSILRMCDRIKKRVENQLQRTYWLDVSGPFISPPLKKIEQRAISYIHNGKTEEAVLDDHGRVRIKTFPAPPRFVGTVGIDPSLAAGDGTSLVEDIRVSHNISLTRILDEKLPKLAKLTTYQRRILLIWNAYFFGDPSVVKGMLAKLSLPPAQLDSVFFVFENNVYLVANPGQTPV